MSQNTGISLGALTLSGAQVIVANIQPYNVEHAAMGREGGITENMGREQVNVELHGFFFSGSDDMARTIRQHSGRRMTLAIPSHIVDSHFLKGDVIIQNFQIIQPAGRGHPYYEWIVRGIGSELDPPEFGVIFVRMSGITFAQDLPIFATLHQNYNQELPISATIHQNFNQELSISATGHATFTDLS